MASICLKVDDMPEADAGGASFPCVILTSGELPSRKKSGKSSLPNKQKRF